MGTSSSRSSRARRRRAGRNRSPTRGGIRTCCRRSTCTCASMTHEAPPRHRRNKTGDVGRGPAHASERVAVAIALVLEELIVDQEQGGRHRRFQSRIDVLRVAHREVVGVGHALLDEIFEVVMPCHAACRKSVSHAPGQIGFCTASRVYYLELVHCKRRRRAYLLSRAVAGRLSISPFSNFGPLGTNLRLN